MRLEEILKEGEISQNEFVESLDTTFWEEFMKSDPATKRRVRKKIWITYF